MIYEEKKISIKTLTGETGEVLAMEALNTGLAYHPLKDYPGFCITHLASGYLISKTSLGELWARTEREARLWITELVKKTNWLLSEEELKKSFPQNADIWGYIKACHEIATSGGA